VSAVPHLGDEADIKRTPNLKVTSMEFRRGAAIVTIGVSPIVSDSALMAAGRKALGMNGGTRLDIDSSDGDIHLKKS